MIVGKKIEKETTEIHLQFHDTLIARIRRKHRESNLQQTIRTRIKEKCEHM